MGSGKSHRHKKIEEDFLAAYDENANALFRHCFARVRDRELAKDIVQETFTRTWEYLAEGKQIGHLRAFLYRTLNNYLVDMMRKKRPVSLDAMTEEDGFEPADVPELPAEIREEMEEAVRLLSRLDDMYAAVITMRFIDEMKPSEIAHGRDLTESVVYVRLHRGVKQRRELWKGRLLARPSTTRVQTPSDT